MKILLTKTSNKDIKIELKIYDSPHIYIETARIPSLSVCKERIGAKVHFAWILCKESHSHQGAAEAQISRPSYCLP